MSGDTEEKTLPATPRKLRKAREKGQVASSSDFVGGVHVIVGVLAVVFTWQGMAAVFSTSLSRSVAHLPEPTIRAIHDSLALTVWSLIGALAPLMIVCWLGALVSNMLHKRGIPFSLHPITPDFSRLSPTKGLKKIFSGRNGIEFAISLARIIVWFAAIGLVAYLVVGQALFSSVCGLGCVGRVSLDAVGMALIVAAVLLLAAGMIDLPLQVSLFMKEQRMSPSEAKREQKEQMGTPEMRQYRKERAREILDAAGASGEQPSLIIADGRRMAISIYFERGKTPIPIVLTKARGGPASIMVEGAAERGVPVENDRALARELYRTCEDGGRIKEKQFEPVALALAKNGAFG